MKLTTFTSKSFTLFIISLLVLTTPAPALANWRVTSTGHVSHEGDVLGKTDNPGQAISQANRSNNAGSDNNSNRGQDNRPDNPGNQNNNQDNTDNTPPGLMNKQMESVSTRNRGNTKSIEVRSNNNNRLELRMQNIDNTQEATESDELVIEDDEDQNVTKIRGRDRASYVIRNRVAAQTNFPLQVNLETNELMVTTPAGTKTVTVLPDAAVQNMLAANVLDQLGGKGGLRWLEEQESATPSATPEATDSADVDDDEATESGEIDEDEATDSAEASPSATPAPTPTETTEPEVETEAETVIELVEDEDGTLTYRIEGVKEERLLGLRDIDLNRVAVVSAETGELIRVEQDLYTTLLDWLSV